MTAREVALEVAATSGRCDVYEQLTEHINMSHVSICSRIVIML